MEQEVASAPSQEELKETETPETVSESVEPVKEVEVKSEATVKEVVEKLAEKVAQKEVAAPEIPPPPAYSPNTKFRVMDKEHEFDDFVRDVVTNEEREKKLRELYEKAYGLDVVKPKYQETREKFKALETQHQNLTNGIQNFEKMIERGDWDTFFERLQVPKEKIYEWVSRVVQYHEAAPDEKARIDAAKNAQRQAWESEAKSSELQTLVRNQEVDFLRREMDLLFSQPDVRALAEAYDVKAGQPGAFKKLTIDRGDLAWIRRKERWTAKQAVDEAMSLVKPFVGQTPASLPAPTVVSGQQTPPQAQKPKVIPNIQGKANAHIGNAKVKSIDDIRRKYKEMTGN